MLITPIWKLNSMGLWQHCINDILLTLKRGLRYCHWKSAVFRIEKPQFPRIIKGKFAERNSKKKIVNTLVSVPNDGYNSVNISGFKIFVLRINNCMNFTLLQQKILK